LKAAEEKKSGVQTWKQTYEYDRYGNRRMTEGTGQTTANVMPAANPTMSQVNNRITASGYSYDSAGNMTGAPGEGYSFDAENRYAMPAANPATSTANNRITTVGCQYGAENGGLYLFSFLSGGRPSPASTIN
jgi:hypothetical protein